MPAFHFSTHDAARMGRETAAAVLAQLESDRVVAGFVDRYARQYGRRELKASPLRYRELLILLTRESLVAIAAWLQSELPRRFLGRARKPPSAEAMQAADAFLQAFAQTIAAALRWTPGEVAEFASDVALYGRMAALAERRAAPAPQVRGRSNAGRASAGAKGVPLYLRSRAMERPAGPFADRCAMLLDPSLMEKARAAAAALHGELERIAAASLSKPLRTKSS